MSETFVNQEEKHYNKIFVPEAKKKKTIILKKRRFKGQINSRKKQSCQWCHYFTVENLTIISLTDFIKWRKLYGS